VRSFRFRRPASCQAPFRRRSAAAGHKDSDENADDCSHVDPSCCWTSSLSPSWGVELDRVNDGRRRLQHGLEAARFMTIALGKPLASKVGQAGGWDTAMR
jgi:hypothetical protein